MNLLAMSKFRSEAQNGGVWRACAVQNWPKTAKNYWRDVGWRSSGNVAYSLLPRFLVFLLFLVFVHE